MYTSLSLSIYCERYCEFLKPYELFIYNVLSTLSSSSVTFLSIICKLFLREEPRFIYYELQP